jgi:hypothetical protein
MILFKRLIEFCKIGMVWQPNNLWKGLSSLIAIEECISPYSLVPWALYSGGGIGHTLEYFSSCKCLKNGNFH